MTKKDPNQFAAIIAARQNESAQQEPATETPDPIMDKKERNGKRGNPEYSAVTVYIPTEIYALAQFEMTRRGRKREMSQLFTELLEEWLKRQK